MEQIKVKKRIPILVLMILLCCFCYFPMHYEGETTITALSDGHEATMQYDFTVYKSLLLCSKVRGNITVEGREHGDIRQFEEKHYLPYDLTLPKAEYTWKERWERKKLEWKKGALIEFYGLYPKREDYPEMPGDPALKHLHQDSVLQMHRLDMTLNGKDLEGTVSWYVESTFGEDGSVSSRGTGYAFTVVLD